MKISLNNLMNGKLNGLLDTYMHPLEEKYHSKNLILIIFIILLLFSIFILLGINSLNANTNPEAVDTTAYLTEANLIKNNGGITNFLNLCINGKYKQANQHPLYILILSTFASRNISFFINAKITSFMIGLVLLMALYIIVSKKYGNLCASIAVFGLLLNTVFLKWTSLVACESLIMLFSLLCMYFVTSGFKNNKYWSYAGISAGLAYLAKGTALFLIPGFLAAVLLEYRSNFFKNKHIYIFFSLFIIISSPLLIRNIVVYQNPFFNINNKKLSVSKKQGGGSTYKITSPEVGSNFYVFPEIDREKNRENSGLSDKFALMHSLAKKIVSRLKIETKVFLNTLNILPFNNFSKLKREIFCLSLLLFFLIGITRVKSNAEKLYVVLTVVIFIVCLTLFRPLPRYLLPIIPYVWIYIALGILTLVDQFSKFFLHRFKNLNVIIFTSILLSGCSILILGWTITSKNISNPLKSVEYSDSRHDLLTWLRENLTKDDLYCEGPNFNWQLDKGTWVQVPKNNRLSMVKFNSFLKKHGIKYVIVEWYALTVSRYRGGRVDRMKKYKGYFDLDSLDGIVQKKNVKDWQLIYKDSRKKVNFMVFKTIYGA